MQAPAGARQVSGVKQVASWTLRPHVSRTAVAHHTGDARLRKIGPRSP